MRLDFKLLVVDDDVSGVRSAVGILEDHVGDRGFTLVKEEREDLTEGALRELVRRQGKQFDLVMVDYKLQGRGNGANTVERLRKEMKYTDMVFYSSDPSAELYKEIANREIQGVFVSNRDELGGVLPDIADRIIGKAVDLSHTRGLAMAEVAEHDVLMAETLAIALASAGNECVSEKRARTQVRLVASKQDLAKEVADRVNGGAIWEMVWNGRLFTLSDKVQAMNRLVRCVDTGIDEARSVFARYEQEVVPKRNQLAHAIDRNEARRDSCVVSDGKEREIEGGRRNYR